MSDEWAPHLLWGDNEQAEYHTVDELLILLEKITAIAQREHMPVGVQIVGAPDSCLLITVGGEESHLEFYSSTQRPRGVGCIGPWEDHTLVTIDFMGEPTELARQFFVPIADARKALSWYLATGTRPDNIMWGHTPAQQDWTAK